MDKSVSVTITGVRPLLMNAPRAVNPLSPEYKAAKQITSKRKKTDEDQLKLNELSWRHSFYHDEHFRPIVPSDCIMGMIVAASAKLRKKKSAQSAVAIEEDATLQHDHPAGLNATVEDFWQAGTKYIDARLVGIPSTRGKVMRYRPRFDKWSINFKVRLYDEMDIDEFKQILEIASCQIGLGDFRPRFGLFEIKQFKVV